MNWHTRIAYNPIVLRAFRVGFRGGPHSFRIGIWGMILAAIILIFVVLRVTGRLQGESGTEGLWFFLVASLLMFTASTFLFGGLQRVLVAFSQERERGTFDFLHLSTLRPASIITGFLLAGQLPGYLLLVITLPVMAIGVLLGGGSIPHLLGLVALMIGYLLFLSVFFLMLGFWMQRASDLRSMALVLLIIGSFVLSAVSGPFGQSLLPLIAVHPVLSSQWQRCFHEGGGVSIIWFGQSIPCELLAVVLFVPIGIVLFRSLARSLRQRERPPLSPMSGAFVVCWGQVLLLGSLWNGAQPLPVQGVVQAMVTWLLGGWLLALGTRGDESLERLFFRTWHKSTTHRALDPEAPPYLLAVVLAVGLPAVFALACVAADQPVNASVFLFSIPIWIPFLLRQWLTWELPGLRRFGPPTFSMLLIWLPALGHLLLPLWVSEHPGGASVLEGMTAVSPFVALFRLFPGASPATTATHIGMAVGQCGFAACVIVLGVLHARSLRRMRGIAARAAQAAHDRAQESAESPAAPPTFDQTTALPPPR